MRARKQSLWLPCTERKAGQRECHGVFLDLPLSFTALSCYLGKAKLKCMHSEIGKRIEEEKHSLAS